MTTAITTSANRIFKYGTHSFPDPGGQHTTEDVLNHLRAYFPELGNASTEQTTLANGTIEITFHKQVTRKGADTPSNFVQAPASPIQTLVYLLAQATPFENPLQPVYAALAESVATEGQALTLAMVQQHRQLLQDNAELLQIHTAAIQKLVTACRSLSPTILHHLPLGF